MKFKIGILGIGLVAQAVFSGVSAEAVSQEAHWQTPFCVVTDSRWIVGPYADPRDEIVSQQRVELRWVNGGMPSGLPKAAANLPHGGRAVVEVFPGYGMVRHHLRIEAADGRSAKAASTMPWHHLSTGEAHLDWSLEYARVSTGLDLLLPETTRGGSQYRTIRRSSVECEFNPLMLKERS